MIDSLLLGMRCHPAIRAGILARAAGKPFYFICCTPRGGAFFSTAERDPEQVRERGRWVALPPFSSSIDLSAIAKALTTSPSTGDADPITALKWVRRCRPDLPDSLVNKLFRLRRVRKSSTTPKSTNLHDEAAREQIQRVSAKDTISVGDVILLPSTVKKLPSLRCDYVSSKDETDFIRGLVLYKDPAILVINKPPGLAVQGGNGIQYSIDVIAATSLKFNSPESPRLVHRLDKDCSGVFVMGRTQNSTSVLHSIFRGRTSEASSKDLDIENKALQRTYWALVLGTPRRLEGLISAPLSKIVLDDGASERVAVVDNRTKSSIHAFTKYKVIGSSVHGYTWLELSPLTGRKHQIRVHCAEVLGTPIVGDFKYGWQAHRRWEPLPWSGPMDEHKELAREQRLPWGLELKGGSICAVTPRLHLHCQQMVLPDIGLALRNIQPRPTSRGEIGRLEKLSLVAPLPLHMQTSWNALGF